MQDTAAGYRRGCSGGFDTWPHPPRQRSGGNRQGNGYGGGHESHYGRTGRSLREKATEAAGSTGEATPPAAGTDAHIPAE